MKFFGEKLLPGNTVLGAVFHSFKDIFVILIAVKGLYIHITCIINFKGVGSQINTDLA
jgi:hypothetical protein